MERLNKIVVDYAMKTKLTEVCKASHFTVRKALKGGCMVTPLILKIRKVALDQLGGVELKDEQP